jgi:peroxin-10
MNTVANEAASKETYTYPFAAAPDIIRSAEKDKYLQGILFQHLSNVLRKLYGSRYLHTHSSGINAFTDLLYYGSTTLIGNRTLGEEYCDIVQVQDKGLQAPSLTRRSGFIVSAILVPYFAGKLLPKLRLLLEHRIRSNLQKPQSDGPKSRSHSLQTYILNNLETLMSPSLLYGASLAVFYFTGTYYHIGKRIFGLRYIFTKTNDSADDKISYEVLGALLVIQMLVQGWLHVRNTLESNDQNSGDLIGAYTFQPNNALISNISNMTTQTPTLDKPRYNLSDSGTMAWIQGTQQRKCTLCLEELKDPSATTCGHIFCWSCIADWIREKPECPLCRQPILAQHVLPLRG